MNLGESEVIEVAEKFHDFADLLINKVAPKLSAARADWAEHHPENHPQGVPHRVHTRPLAHDRPDRP
jgi:hypothetical protein